MYSQHYDIVCLEHFVVILFVYIGNKHKIKVHFFMFENYLVLGTFNQAFVLSAWNAERGYFS